MIRLRPYKDSDAETILSWCDSEKAFYQWTAGVLGEYPLTKERFAELGNLMRFTALDDKEIVGFFTLRNPRPTLDEVRFGFVILDPRRRGQGLGKEILRLGQVFAKHVYGAKKASLGVFENNMGAYWCYRAAGFRDVTGENREQYQVMGENWRCLELETQLQEVGK